MASQSVEEDCEINVSPVVNQEPESQSQPIASEEDNTTLFSLPFPRKLWSIVQNEAFKSVKWTKEGDTIMTEVDLFQKEVLHLKGAKKIFETV